MRNLVGKPERIKPFGRPKSRWLDNIQTDLAETVCEDVGWIT
jgi:hypothetical protein